MNKLPVNNEQSVNARASRNLDTQYSFIADIRKREKERLAKAGATNASKERKVKKDSK